MFLTGKLNNMNIGSWNVLSSDMGSNPFEFESLQEDSKENNLIKKMFELSARLFTKENLEIKLKQFLTEKIVKIIEEVVAK